ncbi:hypothetical protein BGZ52_005407 [Haplosporangium bisporale]|nr:hypothetical protein BGZ52_005407 [Haplosporangium bisporale]
MSEKYTSFDPVLERFREISHLEHYWCSLLDNVFLRPLFAAAALTKYAHHVEELGVLHETILEHLCARKNHPLRKASYRLSRVLRFLDLESHRAFKYQGNGHGTTREQPKFGRPGDSLAARAGDIDGHFRCGKKLQDFWVQFPSDTRSAKQLLTLVPESVIKLRLKVPQQCNAFGTNGQVPDGSDAIDSSASLTVQSHSKLESTRVDGTLAEGNSISCSTSWRRVDRASKT